MGLVLLRPRPSDRQAALLQQERLLQQEGRQEALSAELARFHIGAFVEPSKLTVEAFLLQQWLPAVEGRLRPSTRANYKTNLQVHILPALGALKLQRLTAPRIASFYSELLADGRRDGNGLAPKTVRNIHALLHRALKDAVRWGYVPHNRADDVDPPLGASPSGKSGALSSCAPSSPTCATTGCTRSGSSWPRPACAGPSSPASGGATSTSPGPG